MNQMIGTGAALGYASGSYNEARVQTEQVRAAEIPHELERLERTLRGCEQGLETLVGRLEGSVMRCEPPQPTSTGAIGGPIAVPQTPYGSRIQEMVNSAAILNERIQSINARLEV